jgi:hypothetical protein
LIDVRGPQVGLDKLDTGEYRYWDGNDWDATSESEVPALFNDDVGELSVQFHPGMGKWLMTYLNDMDGIDSLLVRESNNLFDWSTSSVIMDCKEPNYWGCYAPYMHSAYFTDDKVYYAVSMWDDYNVSLYYNSFNIVGDPDLSVVLTDNGDVCKNVFVTNNGETEEEWVVTFEYDGIIDYMWNANWTQSGNQVTVQGVGWNNFLQPGETTHSIGFSPL